MVYNPATQLKGLSANYAPAVQTGLAASDVLHKNQEIYRKQREQEDFVAAEKYKSAVMMFINAQKNKTAMEIAKLKVQQAAKDRKSSFLSSLLGSVATVGAAYFTGGASLALTSAGTIAAGNVLGGLGSSSNPNQYPGYSGTA